MQIQNTDLVFPPLCRTFKKSLNYEQFDWLLSRFRSDQNIPRCKRKLIFIIFSLKTLGRVLPLNSFESENISKMNRLISLYVILSLSILLDVMFYNDVFSETRKFLYGHLKCHLYYLLTTTFFFILLFVESSTSHHRDIFICRNCFDVIWKWFKTWIKIH